MPDPAATARARRNKRLGWDSEKRVAKLFGTSRFPANTGGPVDLKPLADGLHIQVKAGGSMPIATIIDGLDAARRGATDSKGLGACVVEYHRAPRNRTIICFDAAEYAAWHGYSSAEDEL